jgi:hypothetical protein
MSAFPTGLDRIKEFYGDPADFRMGDGGVTPEWERMLGFVQLPAPLTLGWDHSIHVTRVRIHYRLVPSLGKVFDRINADGNWHMLHSFDGTYVWRAKRAGDKLSTHSWGIAIDLNASTNQLGTKGDMPIEIIRCFGEEGWEWGGDWQRSDPMHFQACYGY